MPETLKSPSPLELRAQLEDMVRKDLLGPASGLDEEIAEATVRGRYIVGMLAPKDQSVLPDEQDELAEAGTGEVQEGKPASPVPPTTSMLPSAMGMTFSLERSATAILITARWGHYQRVASESLKNDAGDPQKVWKRIPVEGTSAPIELRNGQLGPWFPNLENEDVYVRGLVRERDDAWSVTLYLINAQTEPRILKDEAWVFQPELVVSTPDRAPVFVKRQLPPELSTSNPEDRRMAMLYRRDLEFAVGHGVGVHVEKAPGGWDRAVEISTSVMPAYEVEQMEAPMPEDIPALAKAVLDMRVLSKTNMGNFNAALNPLADAYETWIQEQEASLRKENVTPDLDPYAVDARSSLDDCRATLKRIRTGIALLNDDTKAAEAFRFANRVMAEQRVHSIYTRQVRQGQEANLEAVDVPENHSWFPFQLAFILLNLPGLVDPTHPDRSHPTSAIADLLWFPTGGGKTEAYLSVAAFAMAVRRLQNESDWPFGGAGVTVLMRYTLRLLTLQQFQRAATLLCACELIRRDDPEKWGEEPFRIGLWVGQKSTPNWTSEADEIIKQDHGHYQHGAVGGKGTPAQLTNCPWCGRPIRPGKDIRVETYAQGRGRTFQYCSDQYGRCPFSFKQSPDDGIPIVVVDEEVYRRLPSLLIATVDKFAQMPWKGASQMLFGQINGKCPRHGYRSPEIEDVDRHPKRGYLEAVKTQTMVPLRPPDLIIQDELHLISGPLGTLVGLYETGVDQLSTWELGGVQIRPKVIASTATIRRARDQVYSIFLREVKIFPPPGLDVTDNFFSRRVPSSEENPGRGYIGICAPGTRLKTAMIRVYAAYMAAAQVLYEKYGRAADPWMTLVGYFNSMRELGGMRRVVDDTLRTRLRRMDQRGLASRKIYPFSVDELTSRKGGTEIPKILDRLEAVFDPQDVSERRAAREAGERPGSSRYPLDVVLATNMISVGVDVGRLGLMVVAGQPKATAEYIQASSRVGRRFPGIVCTIYNLARPRDISHYERFEHYHATFYQQVEALSVTPFSPRALDKGISAVLVSLMRLANEDLNANDAAGKFTRTYPDLDQMVEAIVRRSELASGDAETGKLTRGMLNDRIDEWINETQKPPPTILSYTHKKGGVYVPLLKQPTEGDRHTFTCLNSLRDVEPEIDLILDNYGMDRPPGSAATETEEV